MLCIIFITVVGSYYVRKTLVFYLKFSLFLLCLFSMSIVVIVWALVTRCGKTTKNYRFFIWGCRNLSAIYGWKYNITGRRYIQTDEAIVAVVNHQSELDILCLSELWKNVHFPNTVVGKHTIKYYGVFGAACCLCNLFLINRNDLSTSLLQMKSILQEINKKKLKVFMFPEGRRNSSGNLVPFKKGAFHIAIDAQVSIVPVVISSLKPLHDKEKRRFESGLITITCLPPVSTRGLSKNDIPELMESVRSSMIETFNYTSVERNSFNHDQ